MRSSSAPPSCRLLTTPEQRLPHVRSYAPRAEDLHFVDGIALADEPTAMAAAVAELVERPAARRATGAAARRRVEQEYSLEALRVSLRQVLGQFDGENTRRIWYKHSPVLYWISCSQRLPSSGMPMNESAILESSPVSETAHAPVIVIRARHRWFEVNLTELWEYRELLYFFIWRDLKVRYKQTVIGVAWAVIQPLFTMIVFSIFFGRLAGLPSDGIPHPIFFYTALLPWTYFANAVTQASNVIVAHQNVIKKVYFARVLLPVSAVLSGLADFAVASVILVGMMLAYGIVPTWKIFWLLPLLLLAILTAMAVSLWLAALNALYRDVRYAVPFLLQFWMFASPVAYPASLVPDQWRLLYGLNPMAGVIEGFRWALVGAGPGPGPMLAVSSAVILIVFVTGFFYFQRMERTVADVV